MTNRTTATTTFNARGAGDVSAPSPAALVARINELKRDLSVERVLKQRAQEAAARGESLARMLMDWHGKAGVDGIVTLRTASQVFELARRIVEHR